jgi:ketosteroid isomerase-like protein
MNSTINHETLEHFYAAFHDRDGSAMSACYHSDATFRDPVFDLEGSEVGSMWRMLCARSTDLRIEYSNMKTEADRGSADWQAWYTFSSSGRSVHNVVHSRFRFAEGRIIEQIDTFAFWRWSRQALGSTGALFGWTPYLQRKVQTTARAALERYMAAERLTA